MPSSVFAAPGLTIALAIAAGLAAQVIARRIGIPAIVILLGTGVLFGPDVANVVRPSSVGAALPILISFSVAVILFEGGLSLDLRRLRREGRAIRQLATVGALVSSVGGAVLAHAVMGWPWRLSMLFGTLAMVTGPTVVNPLLKRLRVESSTATVLEAEGVLVDALGAISATVALEVALKPTGERFALGLLQIGLRLGFGILAGGLIGFALARLLRTRNVLPEGLENIVTLAVVLLLYQASNAAQPESGIPAVICAGAVVGNSQTHVNRQLVEFKEQLTTMFIGMLFVLLAADVRLLDLRALGWAGAATVGLLMLVVRPLAVALGTWGTGLTPPRKAFLAWIGPRGIVAAAVASFFAERLEAAGVNGGRPLRALVFLLIACTVVVAGTTGGLVGKLLGLRRKSDDGWVMLGANELALALGKILQGGGEAVVCIDTNPVAARAAEEAGLRVILGDALKDLALARAEVDTRRGVLALVPNDELNLLFLRRAKDVAKQIRTAAVMAPGKPEAAAQLLEASGAALLFARPVGVDAWSVRLRHGSAHTERLRLGRALEGDAAAAFASAPERLFLPLALHRGETVEPLVGTSSLKEGDEVDFLVDDARADEALQSLADAGWVAASRL